MKKLVEYSDKLQRAVDSVIAPLGIKERQLPTRNGRSTLTERGRDGIYGYKGPFALELVTDKETKEQKVVMKNTAWSEYKRGDDNIYRPTPSKSLAIVDGREYMVPEQSCVIRSGDIEGDTNYYIVLEFTSHMKYKEDAFKLKTYSGTHLSTNAYVLGCLTQTTDEDGMHLREDLTLHQLHFGPLRVTSDEYWGNLKIIVDRVSKDSSEYTITVGDQSDPRYEPRSSGFYVNGVMQKVDVPEPSILPVGTTTVFLKYTTPVDSDGNYREPKSEIVYFASSENDPTSDNYTIYYLIGYVYVEIDGGIRVEQRSQGTPQLSWYYRCLRY